MDIETSLALATLERLNTNRELKELLGELRGLIGDIKDLTREVKKNAN